MMGFSEIKEFSWRNFEHIQRWYRYWCEDSANAKQVASQILALPSWHNVVVISKHQCHAEALYFVR